MGLGGRGEGMAKRFQRNIGRRHRRAFRLAQGGQLGLDQFAWYRVKLHPEIHLGRSRHVENSGLPEARFGTDTPVLNGNGFRADMCRSGDQCGADDRERKFHARKISPGRAEGRRAVAQLHLIVV